MQSFDLLALKLRPCIGNRANDRRLFVVFEIYNKIFDAFFDKIGIFDLFRVTFFLQIRVGGILQISKSTFDKS